MAVASQTDISQGATLELSAFSKSPLHDLIDTGPSSPHKKKKKRLRGKGKGELEEKKRQLKEIDNAIQIST